MTFFVCLFCILSLCPVTLAHPICSDFCFHRFREKGRHSAVVGNKDIDSFLFRNLGSWHGPKIRRDGYQVRKGSDEVPQAGGNPDSNPALWRAHTCKARASILSECSQANSLGGTFCPSAMSNSSQLFYSRALGKTQVIYQHH